MGNIRPAKAADLARIAEILVFNYRLNFYPIFQNDQYYFEQLQVPRLMDEFRSALDSIYVYDDGVVKGFIQVQAQEVKKLFVEPVLQGRSIGAELLEHALAKADIRFLWALEKNHRAIAFYERHGFHLTDIRKPEDGTEEYLVQLERRPA